MKYVKIIYGTEPYLMEKAKAAYLAECASDCGSAPEVVSFQKDEPPPTVAESLEDSSLFGAATVTVWQDPPYLPVRRGGRSRSKVDKKEAWFLEKTASLGRGSYAVFIVHGSLDVNAAFFKALKPYADISACEAVTEKNVMPHVKAYLQQLGFTLAPEAERQMQEMFHTWNEISLLYVFSELEKLTLASPHGNIIHREALSGFFAGTVEKNLYTFTDYFLNRDGAGCVPLIDGLFGKPDVFLKSTAYVLSRVRMLRAYMELKEARVNAAEAERLLSRINKGRPVKNSIYYLQKSGKYWRLGELDELISGLFTLQLHIRRGTASIKDMEALICLYCVRERG